MIKKIFISLAASLFLFTPVLASYTISQGGTATSSFVQGFVYSPGGLAPFTSIASSTFPYPTYTYGSTTYYLASNPAGYITSAGAPVQSVSNMDGTITISPTTGAVIVSRPAITGDVSIPIGSNVSTLATVNSNIGTFQGITVNGKGLVTAAVNQNYVTNSYASSTFPSFTYASTTYALAGTGGNSAWTIGNGFIYNATSTNLVGIGNSNPWAKLNVQGSATSTGMLIDFASSTGSSLFSVLNNGNVGISSTTPGSLLSLNTNTLNSTSTSIFAIASSTGNVMTVFGNGNVSFGSSSPKFPFVFQPNTMTNGINFAIDNSGNGTVMGNTADNGSTAFGNDWVVNDTNSAGSANFQLIGGTAAGQMTMFGPSAHIANEFSIGYNAVGNGGDIKFLANNNITSGGTGAINFAAGGFNNAMSLHISAGNPGNVGIGDSAPAARLSVVGNTTIGYSSAQTAPTNGLIVNGNVGIGSTTPSSAVAIVGTTTSGGYISSNLKSTFLAVDNSGNFIATTTPSGGSTSAVGGVGAVQFATTSAAFSGDPNFSYASSTQTVQSHNYLLKGANATMSLINTNDSSTKKGVWQVSYDGQQFYYDNGNGGGTRLYVGNIFTNTTIVGTGQSVAFPDQTAFETILDDGFGNGMVMGNWGAGSTTPGAKLSVFTNAGGPASKPIVSVASSTTSNTATSTLFTILGNGNVGISTTTPNSLLSIQGTSGSLVSLFSTASSTGSTTFQIDSKGHIITGGTTPTVSGGTSSVVGNDTNGTITITGTLLTSVTLTFAKAYATAPVCVESDNSTSLTADISSISTTQVVFGFSAGVNSGTLWYHCEQTI